MEPMHVTHTYDQLHSSLMAQSMCDYEYELSPIVCGSGGGGTGGQSYPQSHSHKHSAAAGPTQAALSEHIRHKQVEEGPLAKGVCRLHVKCVTLVLIMLVTALTIAERLVLPLADLPVLTPRLYVLRPEPCYTVALYICIVAVFGILICGTCGVACQHQQTMSICPMAMCFVAFWEVFGIVITLCIMLIQSDQENTILHEEYKKNQYITYKSGRAEVMTFSAFVVDFKVMSGLDVFVHLLLLAFYAAATRITWRCREYTKQRQRLGLPPTTLTGRLIDVTPVPS